MNLQYIKSNIYIFFIILSSLLFFISNPWIRFIGYAFLLLGFSLWSLNNQKVLQTILFFTFLLAYIISPYWNLKLPFLAFPKWFIISLLILIAALWANYHVLCLEGNAQKYYINKYEFIGWVILLIIWSMV